MICQKCGNQNEEGCRFCVRCGEKMNPVTTSPVNSNPVNTNPSGGNNYGTNTGFNQAVKRCIRCSQPMPAEYIFCPNCRTPQSGAQNGPAGQPAAARMYSPEEIAARKNRTIIIAIVIVTVLALFAGIGIIAVLHKPSISLNDYVTVSFEGYHTVGTATAVFDKEKFEADYGKKIKSKMSEEVKKSAKEYGDYAGLVDGLMNGLESYDQTSTIYTDLFLSSCVTGSLSKEEGLSNGDKVTYTWQCNEEYALQKFGFKLKYSDMEFTVENLTEAETFDPFEGIEVVFEGISPNGEASISRTQNDSVAQDLEYYLDVDSGLKNGDTVTVSIEAYYNDDVVEYCIENYGKIPSALEKTYTVSGLNSFIQSASEVSDLCLKEMKSQAEDVFGANVAKEWGEGEQLAGFTYIGNYLLTAKSEDRYWDSGFNKFFLVYKVEVNNSCINEGISYKKTNTYYWYIEYDDILSDSAGNNTIDILTYELPSDMVEIDSGVSDGWYTTTWEYYGYPSAEELYKKVVLSCVDEYNHEDNIDENLAKADAAAPIISNADTNSQNLTDRNNQSDRTNNSSGSTTDEEGFIFPNSSEVLISDREIKALSDQDLRYAINEIYAKHGYIFKDDGLRTYFEQFRWYKKEVSPENFSDSVFNSIEKNNVERMQSEREARGGQ